MEIPLPLIKTSDYEGYEYDAICAWLIKSFGKAREEQFREFMAGQTGGLTDDGKFVVYAWDLERFLKNDKLANALWDD